MENVYFEKIEKGFYRGKYIDIEIYIMKKNDFINATDLVAKISNKDFRKWKNNISSKELIEEIYKIKSLDEEDLFEKVKNGKNNLRGTYVNILLLPNILQWASPKHSLKISEIVNKYANRKAEKEKQKLLGEKDDEIKKLSKKIDKLSLNVDNHKNELIMKANENIELSKYNTDLLKKLAKSRHKSIVPIKNKSKRDIFSVVKYTKYVREYDNYDFIYHVIRRQEISFKPTLKKFLADNENAVEIYNTDENFHNKNLWCRSKEQLGDNPRKRLNMIEYSGNDFNIINNYSETDLINSFDSINDQKYEDKYYESSEDESDRENDESE